MPRRSGKPRAEASLETRDALLRAGAEAIARDGLDAPSLDSICERAGFTRGAFYVHFKDRSDFIAAVMDSLTAGFVDSLFGPNAAAADITQVVRSFAQAVASGRYPLPGGVRLHHVLDACSRDAEVRARRAAVYEGAIAAVSASVDAGRADGALRDDVETAPLATLMVAMVLGIEVLSELKVPFKPLRAGDTLVSLLRPASHPPKEPQRKAPVTGNRRRAAKPSR